MQNIKILLVDDDELSLRMMGLLLSGEGYEFETASDGLEAVKAVQKGNIDFVLMDLQMPHMDGYEATSKIRLWEAETNHKHTMIVALTAMLFEQETKRCMDAGMDDCLLKPFNTTELFQLIEAYASGTKITQTNAKKPNDEEYAELKILDIESALPRFRGDLKTYQEYLDEFIGMLSERSKELYDNFHEQNYKGLVDGAHNLKGVAASLGAMHLSGVAHQLERHGENKDVQQIEIFLREMDSMISVFQETAQDYILEFERDNEKQSLS